jgi:hypothetical protein
MICIVIFFVGKKQQNFTGCYNTFITIKRVAFMLFVHCLWVIMETKTHDILL